MNKKDLFIECLGILKETCRMISNIHALNKSGNETLSDDVIYDNLEAMKDQNARLKLRREIIGSIGTFKHSNDDLNEEMGIFLCDNNLLEYLARVLREVEDPNKKELAIEALNKIQYLRGTEEFNLEEIIRYLEIKDRCIYQDVIKFIDNNYSYICNDYHCTRFINDIVENYTKAGLNRPPIYDCRVEESMIAVDDDDLYTRDKNAFISLVNGVFASYVDKVPLIDDPSFIDDKCVKMLKKLVDPQELDKSVN